MTFEMAELPNNEIFLSTFFSITNPITLQPEHLKCDEIGSKCSGFDVSPTVGYASISPFQRTLKQCRTTNWIACDSFFLKLGAKCPQNA